MILRNRRRSQCQLPRCHAAGRACHPLSSGTSPFVSPPNGHARQRLLKVMLAGVGNFAAAEVEPSGLGQPLPVEYILAVDLAWRAAGIPDFVIGPWAGSFSSGGYGFRSGRERGSISTGATTRTPHADRESHPNVETAEAAEARSPGVVEGQALRYRRRRGGQQYRLRPVDGRPPPGHAGCVPSPRCVDGSRRRAGHP